MTGTPGRSAPEHPQCAPWEHRRPILRSYRLSHQGFRPDLARSLEAAVKAAGPLGRHSRGGRPPSGRGTNDRPTETGPSRELYRSFVGALARLSDREVAHLVAALEVLTFPLMVRAVVNVSRSRRTRLDALLARWKDAAARHAGDDPVHLREKLVVTLRRRIAQAGGTGHDLEEGLLGLYREWVSVVGQEYGVAAGPRCDPELVQEVLLASARNLGAAPPLVRLAGEGRRSVRSLIETGTAVCALAGLGYVWRRPLALTATTVIHVLLNGLFGIWLPLEFYRWIAVALTVLLEPPVSLVALTTAGTLLYARRRRQFDRRLLSLVLLSVYQVDGWGCTAVETPGRPRAA